MGFAHPSIFTFTMRKLLLITLVGVAISACTSNTIEDQVDEKLELKDVLLSSEDALAKSPYITEDHNGVPVVSWVEGEEENAFLYYARWNNKSNDFLKSVKVDVTKGLAAHHESMPKIAFKEDGTAYVVYQIKKATPTNRFASRLYYSFSKDEKRWSAPKQLHTDTSDGVGRSFFDLARLSDGEIGAVWLDGRKKQRDGSTLMFSKTNKENTFQKDIEIGQKTCQCCRTDIYVDGNGVINVAYRDIINDSIRDMVHLASSDNGKTFSSPVRISQDNWVLDGCPHTGPSMAHNSNGLHFFWFTAGGGEGVYTTRIVDGGTQFPERSLINPHARHPQVISTKNNDLVLVWDETFKTDSAYVDRIGITIGESKKKYISAEEVNSDHPVLSELGDSRILVVWAQAGIGKPSIQYKVVSSEN